MSHSLFISARGMMKRKPPGYYEKIAELREEIFERPRARDIACSVKPGDAQGSLTHSPDTVRRWWKEGALA